MYISETFNKILLVKSYYKVDYEDLTEAQKISFIYCFMKTEKRLKLGRDTLPIFINNLVGASLIVSYIEKYKELIKNNDEVERIIQACENIDSYDGDRNIRSYIFALNQLAECCFDFVKSNKIDSDLLEFVDLFSDRSKKEK